MDQDQVNFNTNRVKDEAVSSIPLACYADGQHLLNQFPIDYQNNRDLISSQFQHNYQHHQHEFGPSARNGLGTDNNSNNTGPRDQDLQYQQTQHQANQCALNHNQTTHQFANIMSSYHQYAPTQVNSAAILTSNMDASANHDFLFASLSSEACLNQEILNQHLTATTSTSFSKQSLITNYDNNLYDCDQESNISQDEIDSIEDGDENGVNDDYRTMTNSNVSFQQQSKQKANLVQSPRQDAAIVAASKSPCNKRVSSSQHGSTAKSKKTR